MGQTEEDNFGLFRWSHNLCGFLKHLNSGVKLKMIQNNNIDIKPTLLISVYEAI